MVEEDSNIYASFHIDAAPDIGFPGVDYGITNSGEIVGLDNRTELNHLLHTMTSDRTFERDGQQVSYLEDIAAGLDAPAREAMLVQLQDMATASGKALTAEQLQMLQTTLTPNASSASPIRTDQAPDAPLDVSVAFGYGGNARGEELTADDLEFDGPIPEPSRPVSVEPAVQPVQETPAQPETTERTWSYNLANDGDSTIEQFELESVAAALTAMGYGEVGANKADIEAAMGNFIEDRNAIEGRDQLPASYANLDGMSADQFANMQGELLQAINDDFSRPGAAQSESMSMDIRLLGSEEAMVLQEALGVDADGIVGPETIAAYNAMAEERGIDVGDANNPQLNIASIEAIAAISNAVGAHGAEISQGEQMALQNVQQKIGNGEIEMNAQAMAELNDVISAMAESGNDLQSEEVQGQIDEFAAALTVPGQGASAGAAFGR